jgi:hypothetical protein
MFDLENPVTHSSHVLQHFVLLLLQTHNGQQPLQSLLARVVHGCPFFSSRPKLV